MRNLGEREGRRGGQRGIRMRGQTGEEEGRSRRGGGRVGRDGM